MNLLKSNLLLACIFFQINLVVSQDVVNDEPSQVLDTTKTLFSSFQLKTLGLYLAPEASYGQYASEYTSLNGGSLMLLLNNKWALGINGQSSQRNSFTPTTLNANGALQMNIQNAGLRVEYTINPHKVIHFSFPITLGVGRVSVDSINALRNVFDSHGRSHRYGFRNNDNVTTFGHIQPGINIEVNIFKYGKVFFGGSYRIATNTSTNAIAPYTLTTGQLSGLNINVGAKLGLFNYRLTKSQE